MLSECLFLINIHSHKTSVPCNAYRIRTVDTKARNTRQQPSPCQVAGKIFVTFSMHVHQKVQHLRKKKLKWLVDNLKRSMHTAVQQLIQESRHETYRQLLCLSSLWRTRSAAHLHRYNRLKYDINKLFSQLIDWYLSSDEFIISFSIPTAAALRIMSVWDLVNLILVCSANEACPETLYSHHLDLAMLLSYAPMLQRRTCGLFTEPLNYAWYFIHLL